MQFLIILFEILYDVTLLLQPRFSAKPRLGFMREDELLSSYKNAILLQKGNIETIFLKTDQWR